MPSDEQLGDAIEALSEGFALFDRDGMLVGFNSSFQKLHPRCADLIAPGGVSWDLLLHEAEQRSDISSEVANRLRLAEARLAHSDPPETIEFEEHGGRFVAATLSPTSQGGFVLTLRDDTARRRLEAKEREGDMLLRRVLEACPASVMMCRLDDGVVLYRSPAATELVGTAKTSSDYFASRSERADFITAILPNGRFDDLKATCLRSDGTPFPALISARLIDYHGDDVVVLSILDLTRDMAMQDELVRQKELTFQSEKMSALGELLAGVAHELNNPLSIVVGNAVILKEEIRDDRRAIRVAKLANAAERCVGIVRTFLAMARENPLELAPADIAELIGTARDTFLAGASEAPLDLSFDVAACLPRVMADEVQLVQVLVNLMTNAQQALAETGRHGLVSVSARLGKTRDWVVISVRDDGPGVPRDLRTRIFDPLFTTKTGGRGTGMGLALCRRILLAHGGSIRLVGSEGPGAEFELELPVAHSPERDPRSNAV
jgi:signal transduction histidine kinase